ncbi:transporter bos1 [Lineolata rhizophorae]|uniref:Protein transport protein BOS1 n=1 Tax=Lineolata rhizophorae TaxID=578093 RepID=A0A6A6NWV0_9PEZI|nr:transporter bos1 [Lineolata rhizophorae]
MNTLFNSAFRQSTNIRKDLDAFSSSGTLTPAQQGQLNASLASFSRTIDDYNKLAKQELVAAKQEKAYERVKSFREELREFREQIEQLKAESDEQQTITSRNELLGRRPHHTATPENPYATATISANAAQYSAFRPSAASSLQSPFGTGPADYNRETHALREQSFVSQTNAQLDEFLERGRAVLGDLSDQREMLKGTQRRLYSVANTLGVSGDTIRMVERRAKQDKWIFWGGVVVFFVFCWLVLRWLR